MLSLDDKKILEAMELYPSLWVAQHQIKTESGLPVEFKKHRFMLDLYNDMSPLQVWLKPPQIGATVAQILKSFYVAKKLRKDIIYTLPTASDVNDMAGGKINRLVAQNPILSKWVKDHDTVDQKAVGENIIYYRGTFSPKQAMMVSSSLNIHDEVDSSDPQVITQYETRLQAQADGMRWYFSHPSLAGHGVDVYWQQSDKKEWFIVCPTCNKEQILTWPNNIKDGEYVCTTCSAILSDETRIRGEWKATSTGEFSGYHISQLMCPWISATLIVKAFNDPLKDKQYFYNYVLGLPYLGSEDKIDSATVLKNCVNQVNPQESRIIIGVDTGLPIHFTLANKEGVFYYGTCEPETEAEKKNPSYDPYDKLRSFLRRWPKSMLVSDQGGDLIGIRKLQNEFPGRVFLCWYRKDRKTNDLIKWGEGEEYGTVVVDRNRMIQLIVEQMRDIGRIRLNGTKEEWEEWANHFNNIYREKVIVKEVKDKDDRSLYGAEYVWKRNGPDHYVHCLLYALVGLNKYAENLATIVGEDPFGSTPIGKIVQAEEGYSSGYIANSRVDL